MYPVFARGPRCFYRTDQGRNVAYNPNGPFPPVIAVFGPFDASVVSCAPALWSAGQRAWLPVFTFSGGPGGARSASGFR